MQGWADQLPGWLLSWWAIVSAVGAVLVAAGAALHVVLSQREVRSSIGWLGLIVMVPLLGGIIYALFGINRVKRAAEELKRRGVRPYDPVPGTRVTRTQEVVEHFTNRPALGELASIVDEVSHRSLLVGNLIEPLVDGDEAYPVMLDAIRNATVSVSLASYIFDDDRVGRKFLDALSDANGRGVEVRVLVDAAGARYSFPRIDKQLKRRGVTTRRFLPMAPGRIRYFNLRNHRKVLVVDGKVGFTGGMNIRHGHWVGLEPKHPVRDIHFRLEGPVVAQLQEVFVQDWEFSSREALRGPTWFPDLPPCGPTLARGIQDGPDENMDVLNWTLLGAINSATRSIRIATPYFLPDPPMAQALNLAAMRGVEVDIVLPERSNLFYMDWAMWGQFWMVMGHGVRLWLTPPPFDHSKLMVVDDYWTLFGSSNWDPRSLRLNFEFNVEAYCDVLGPRTVELFENRIRMATRVTERDLAARGILRRLRDSVARLASPYL